MNLKEQIAKLQNEIRQWQLDPSGSTAMKRQLQALQSELDNLVKRERAPSGDRRRPRLAVVKPTPPPQVHLTPDEQAIWSSFFNFHRALLQYTGWVNRTEWLQMADVAADMTGGNPMLSEEFPSGPGMWVWDGTSRLWVRTNGIPFPTHDKVWGWDGDNQRWVKISEQDHDGGDQMGVTDGSDAASGKVGEFLSATNAAVMPISSNGVYTLLGMLTLPAGDWTVGGEIDMWLDTIPTDWVASYVFLGPPPYPTVLDTDVGLDRAWNHEKNPAGIDSQTTTSLGPFRISSSSSTQIAMMAVYYCSQLYTGGADYVIWARRTR